jgi:hypothetical protein
MPVKPGLSLKSHQGALATALVLLNMPKKSLFVNLGLCFPV